MEASSNKVLLSCLVAIAIHFHHLRHRDCDEDDVVDD